MKLLSLFPLFLFISCAVLGQSSNFQGFILYKYEFKDLKGNDITDKMAVDYGSEQHYYINLKNYKSLNQKQELTQLYNSESNKYYFQMGNEIRVIDASLEYPKTSRHSRSEETLTLLGKDCKSIIVKGDDDETIYFFSGEIAVDVPTFSKHRFGGWSEYLKTSNGALPLKFIVKKKEYTWTATAIEVRMEEYPNSDFDIQVILKERK